VHFDLLICGGTIATSGGLAQGDVGVRNGKIVEIGSLKNADAEETLDANGLIVMPGVIDTQVHFREPGLEHKENLESGTRAAIVGGVTTVFEMPNTNPTTTTQEALEDKLRRAEGRAWCNYAFFVGATTENVEELARLERLPGTPGIKIFMGSSTGPLLVAGDEHLRQVLRNGARRCPIHAEDEARNLSRKELITDAPHPREHPYLRDAESARLATQRILALSAETRRPVHILHLSTGDEIPLISRAKKEGLGTTAEITPQHLFFSAPDCYDRLGTLAQMNPPLRDGWHRDALRRALQAGVFDVVGSDHAPHTLEEKAQPYPKSPSGMPGVQTLLPVMLTLCKQGLLSIPTLVRMTSEAPAEIYGIQGKGHLQPGYDADLVLVDPDKSVVFDRSMVQSKCGWSPYEGEELTGWPAHVVLGGRVAVRDGILTERPHGTPVRFDWKENS
jgi:dihydroorotase